MAENPVRSYKVIVIGGSAGSLEVVLKIVKELQPSVTSIFIIVLHRKNAADSVLPDLLSSRTVLPVREVEDKEPIQPGTIYIAPPDYHLLIEDEETFSLDSSEKVQFSRPSIDVTFESVAECFGAEVLGILLSGANADGAEGLGRIKAAGGYTVAQNPLSSDVGYMPQQAVNLGVVDEVLEADAILKMVKRVLQ